MADEERDALDRLLDEGLAAYANREPRAGLESRILYRVRGERAPRGFPLLRWALPVAAAACLAAAVVYWSHRAPEPAPPPRIAESAATIPARAPVEVAKPEPPPRPARRNAPRRTLPKRPEFPTPTPLTSEERALLAIYRVAPELALEVLGERAESEMEPNGIEEVNQQLTPGSGSE